VDGSSMLKHWLKFGPDVPVRSTILNRRIALALGGIALLPAVVLAAYLTQWAAVLLVWLIGLRLLVVWDETLNECPYCHPAAHRTFREIPLNLFAVYCSNCGRDLRLGFDQSKAAPSCPLAD
jgi:hypothetical protein